MSWLIILAIPAMFWLGLIIGAVVEFPKLFGYEYEREEYLGNLLGLTVFTIVLGVISGILFLLFN